METEMLGNKTPETRIKATGGKNDWYFTTIVKEQNRYIERGRYEFLYGTPVKAELKENQYNGILYRNLHITFVHEDKKATVQFPVNNGTLGMVNSLLNYLNETGNLLEALKISLYMKERFKCISVQLNDVPVKWKYQPGNIPPEIELINEFVKMLK